MSHSGTLTHDRDHELKSYISELSLWTEGQPVLGSGSCMAWKVCRCQRYSGIFQAGYRCTGCGHPYEQHYG
jgi:hypothetical protein